MIITIKKTTFQELSPLIEMATKEGMRIYDIAGSDWFCAVVDGELAGFVSCYIREKHKKAIFKSDYVAISYRRQGIYKQLFEYRLNYAKKFDVTTITAACTKKSMGCFESFGFIKNGKDSNKYKGVVMHLIREEGVEENEGNTS
ncbi:GNAT family N-acetyltransferase [Rossellomorea aquimaris]|uniref:GNAT family N-acetyltransferase n=1 Tax=Rossellomorea aquimaris TaxID=189382 RepID=UPI0007D09A51|nr:GNAT family N-acetyltransferase [Rossellomorea aquimaris]